MTFQVKDFPSIVASQIAHMRATQTGLTDFTVGSVLRTLVEAPAIEIDELYQRVLFGLLESIPVAVYDAFGFLARPALSAAGDVLFSVAVLKDVPIEIPAGTVVKVGSDKRRYIVIDDSAIKAGQFSALARVRAEFPGSEWNATSGEINELVTFLSEKVSVINPLPLVNGKDQESGDDRKRRFIAYVNSLSRGTVYANIYCVQSTMLLDSAGIPTEYVTHVGLNESAGRAIFYIYSSAGLPSDALLAKIEKVINGYRESGVTVPGFRPLGVQVELRPMTERRLDLNMRAWSFQEAIPGPAAINAARDALARVINSVAPGDVLYVDQLIDAALSVREIERVAISIDQNIRSQVHEILQLGDLQITWGD